MRQESYMYRIRYITNDGVVCYNDVAASTVAEALSTTYKDCSSLYLVLYVNKLI